MSTLSDNVNQKTFQSKKLYAQENNLSLFTLNEFK